MHHFIQTLKQSLQVRISIALILMFLPLSIIAGAFSYYQTYHEAEELQDDLLRQTAAYINPKTTDYTQIGSENHILIQTFGQEDTVPLSNTLGEGFHTIKGGVDDDDDDEYRAYVRQTPQGKIAVLQETEYRDDLAATAAYQSVLPLLIALPLMILLTVWITYRAMRPVKTLSASSDNAVQTTSRRWTEKACPAKYKASLPPSTNCCNVQAKTSAASNASSPMPPTNCAAP